MTPGYQKMLENCGKKATLIHDFMALYVSKDLTLQMKDQFCLLFRFIT